MQMQSITLDQGGMLSLYPYELSCQFECHERFSLLCLEGQAPFSHERYLKKSYCKNHSFMVFRVNFLSNIQP